MKPAFLLLIVFFQLFILHAQFKIGILGSSTAEGYGAIPIDNSWVNKIAAHYNSIGVNTQVINMAVGGTNPYHAMPDGYIPPPNRPSSNAATNVSAMIAQQPDVVVISFVSNQFNIYTENEIKFTLDVIRNALLTEGIIVYITTTQPRTSFNNAGRQRLADLKELIMEWYGPYSINFFDVLADPADLSIKTEYRFTDAIHINNAGHQVLYEQVLAANIFSEILPVKLQGFSLKNINGFPNLVWEVADEEIATEYSLQHSANNSQFAEIYKTVSAGNHQHNQYHFYHTAIGKKNYYRLKVVEKELVFYSPVLYFENKGFNGQLVKIVPNPSSGEIVLVVNNFHEGQIVLEIVDITGRQLWKKGLPRLNSIQLVSLNELNLPKGLYFLLIRSGDRFSTQKIIRN